MCTMVLVCGEDVNSELHSNHLSPADVMPVRVLSWTGVSAHPSHLSPMMMLMPREVEVSTQKLILVRVAKG